MKKLIVTFFLLLTVISFAEIVYITPTGKKYHATKTCKGLVRAKKIIPIERKVVCQIVLIKKFRL